MSVNKNNIIKTMGCVISGYGWASLAQAQPVPDAGSILRDQLKPALELPVRPAPPVKSEDAIRAAPVTTASRMVLGGIRISGNTIFELPELLAQVQDFVGKDVGLAELDQIAARLTRHYREHGYMVARAYLTRAYVPVPDSKEGIAEIIVIEGRFGTVITNNRSRVRDGVVRGYTGSLSGRVVREHELERKLLLLNDLTGDARGTLQTGKNAGETDLAVELRAAPVVSGSIEVDNHGNRYTGANRVGIRLDASSPLGLGDALSARLTKGFDGLEYARFSYHLPIGGDGLRLGAAYSATRYQLGKTFAALDAQGEAANTSLYVSYPFIRARNMNLRGQVSYEHGDFEDQVNATATATDKQTRTVNVALSGDVYDGAGVTVFSLNFGRGNLNIETPKVRVDDDSSARTHGSYSKWSLNLLRLQSLSERASLYVSIAGQKAGKNLDSSEKFVLGGANGVRAYPQGEATGDSGYVATAELRYVLDAAKLPGVLRPFVFVDAGAVTINENSFAAGINRRRLAGAGLGVSWEKAKDFSVQITLAARLGNQTVTSDTDRHGRVWVQATKHF
jgi:hemolysin activation/secretion protein